MFTSRTFCCAARVRTDTNELTMADANKPVDPELEKKRAEIMRRVAEARAAQDAALKKAKKVEKAPDPRKFGTHLNITCDGCGTAPILGYRWRCHTCKNHDLCDTCYDVFKGGKLLHSNARRNPISMVLDHHEFYALVGVWFFLQ